MAMLDAMEGLVKRYYRATLIVAVPLVPRRRSHCRASLHALQSTPGDLIQMREILRAEIGQLMVLAIAPAIFHRIEFRRIGAHERKPKPSLARFDILPDLAAPVRAEPVPDYLQFTPQVATQMSKKLHDLGPLDCARIEPEVEVPGRDPRDGRPVLSVEVHLQHRRLPMGCPRPDAMGPLAPWLAQSAAGNSSSRPKAGARLASGCTAHRKLSGSTRAPGQRLQPAGIPQASGPAFSAGSTCRTCMGGQLRGPAYSAGPAQATAALRVQGRDAATHPTGGSRHAPSDVGLGHARRQQPRRLPAALFQCREIPTHPLPIIVSLCWLIVAGTIVQNSATVTLFRKSQ